MSRLASKQMLSNDSQHVNQDMSEHVRLIAKSVYDEFEKLITIYGPNIVENLMPIIVNVLENLDELYKGKALSDMELGSIHNDFVTMEKQYEKEKSIRKQNEEKLLNIEFNFDEERKNLNESIEKLELSLKNLELKSKNHNETIQRYDDKIDEMKQENSKLYEKYTELVKSHGELIGKLRSSHSGAVNSNSPNLLSPFNTLHKHHGPNNRNFSGGANDNALQALFFDGTAITRPHNSNSNRFDAASTVSTQVFDESDDDFGDLEYTSCDNKSGIDSELENADENEFGGIRREIENLINENQELHDTKNALNVVKDDLISKVDLLTSNNDILTEKIRVYHNKVEDLTGKLAVVESQLHKARLDLQNVDFHGEGDRGDKEEATGELEQNHRQEKTTFSRSEMAVLLQERNYFKEKFIELQDALLYTETMRIKNQTNKKPASANTGASGSQSSLWKFFRNLLLKSEETEPLSAPINEKIKSVRTSDAGRAGVIASAGKSLDMKIVCVPRFRMESDRSQLYTWSVPRLAVEQSAGLPKHLPIPVRNQKLFEPKDSVACISPGYETSQDETSDGIPDHLWCVKRVSGVTWSNQFYLLQLGLSNDASPSSDTTTTSTSPLSSSSDLLVKYSLKLKFPSCPITICEVPSIIYVIKGLNKLQNLPSPPTSPQKQSQSLSSESEIDDSDQIEGSNNNNNDPSLVHSTPPQSILQQHHQFVSPAHNGKVIKVHQTKLFIASRSKLPVGSKTVWFLCEKNQLIVCVMFDNNKLEGKMATVTLPGSSIVTVKYHQGRVLVLQKNGSLCLFSLNKDLNQWDLNQCVIFDLLKTISSTQSDSGDSDKCKFTDYEFQPITLFNYATNQIWLAAYNQDMKIKNWIFVFDLVTNSVQARFPVETVQRAPGPTQVQECIVAMEMLKSRSLVLVSVSNTCSVVAFDSRNFNTQICLDFESGLSDLIAEPPLKNQTPSTELGESELDVNQNKVNDIQLPSSSSLSAEARISFTHLRVDQYHKLWLVTDNGLILTLSHDDDTHVDHTYSEEYQQHYHHDLWAMTHQHDSGTLLNTVVPSSRIFISAHAFVKSILCLSPITRPQKLSQDVTSNNGSSIATIETATSSSFPIVMAAIGCGYLNLNNTAADVLSLSNHAVVWKV